MIDRAAELIAALGLIPHPEGGYYGELYRSDTTVDPTDGRGPRAALTTIYFLLPGAAVSRWYGPPTSMSPPVPTCDPASWPGLPLMDEPRELSIPGQRSGSEAINLRGRGRENEQPDDRLFEPARDRTPGSAA